MADKRKVNGSRKDDHIFDQAIRTANILVNMFGPRCEVAVHDFSDLHRSLIHLAGTITNREIGAPITDLVLRELKKPSSEIKDIQNYTTTTNKGLLLKSSTVFLRDKEGVIIGALCINFDISLLMQLNGELQQFINFEANQTTVENFYTSVKEIIEGLVRSVLQEFNKAPGQLDLDEKIECVRKLEQKGTFLIKGAHEYIAAVLNVSKFTIYNYLQKIRAQDEYNLD
ncbi:transcriptional regulator [Cohnella suwonensis]|uniref:Transcriptional regulator n=1 Tax=Cohnella suwonensis TaxID=696072 RepID=A0ABW0LZC7_9BACL